jgi:hypothetical protein
MHIAITAVDTNSNPERNVMSKFSESLSQHLMMARFDAERAEGATRFSEADKQLYQASLKGMATAITLYYKVSRSLKSEFPAEVETSEVRDYLHRQTLNIFQRLVDDCMPGLSEPRAVAYLVNDARVKGFAKDIGRYLKALDGLGPAIELAKVKLATRAECEQFAKEDDLL